MRSMNAASRFALVALVASAAAFATPAALAQAAAAPAAAAPKQSVAEFARRAPVMAAGDSAAADPARWGLTVADLSVLDDPALLRKAGLPARAAAVAKAAAADDPIALYLHAVHLRSQGKNAAGGGAADGFMLRASQLGLARAMSFVASGSYIAADSAEKQKPHLEILTGAAGLGNAFSTYMYGQAMLLSKLSGPQQRGEGIQAMGFAAEAGFAPAQLWYARMAYQALDQGENDPGVRKRAKEMLDKAVAQGNADAIAFAKARAAKK